MIGTFFLAIVGLRLMHLQTMESGTTSAQRGRIPLDHGNCSKMAWLWLLVKALKKVGCTQRIFDIRQNKFCLEFYISYMSFL